MEVGNWNERYSNFQPPVTLGGHSTLVPPLPISNRAVKRSCADDSVDSHAKVGHCQAPYNEKPQLVRVGAFCFSAFELAEFIIQISAVPVSGFIVRGFLLPYAPVSGGGVWCQGNLIQWACSPFFISRR